MVLLETIREILAFSLFLSIFVGIVLTICAIDNTLSEDKDYLKKLDEELRKKLNL